jgi:hypothetical protein
VDTRKEMMMRGWSPAEPGLFRLKGSGKGTEVPGGDGVNGKILVLK